MERTSNKSQHTKLTLEKKILLPLLPGLKLATADDESGALTNKLSQLLVSDIRQTMKDCIRVKPKTHSHMSATMWWMKKSPQIKMNEMGMQKQEGQISWK